MRKRFKIPLFGVIIIALAVLVGVVLLYQSHILENWVNRLLAEQVASKYGLEVVISEIDGSFVNGFILRDVLVKYNTKDTSYTMAMLPRISMKYDVGNLWNFQWIVDSLRLDNPKVYLVRDDSGRMVLPQFGTGESSDRTPPSWKVGNVTVINGEFEIAFGDSAIKWYEVYLDAAAQSDEGTITLSVDSMHFNSDDGRLRVNHANGTATIFERNLALQNVRIEADSSYLHFSMTHDESDEPETEVYIQDSRIHLADIVSFVGSGLMGNLKLSGELYNKGGRFGGDVLLSGVFEDRQFDSLHARFHLADKLLFLDSLYGQILDGCAIEGFGDINFGAAPEKYRLVADLENFNLTNLIFNSFTSDLSGHIDIFGRGLRSKTMAIDLDADLSESYFDIYHFHQGIGRMTITNTGLYFFPDFRFDYYDSRFLCEGGVDYKGDLSIIGRAELPDLTHFTHQTFIDLPSGRGRATFAFTGPTNDPALSGTFISDSVFFYDFYSSDFQADFDIESFIHRKQGPITVFSAAGDAWDFPYDSIYSQMTLDSNMLHIDTIAVANRFSRTSGTGNLDYEVYPQKLIIDSLEIELSDRYFYSDGNQVIFVDSSGFQFEDTRIEGTDGFINFDGRADYDETLDIKWLVQSISIGPWVELMNDSIDINGTLSTTGRISGPFANPKFDLEASLDSLTYSGLLLGDLRTFLSYRDTVLSIDSSYLKSPEGIYTANGDFPINLTLSMDHDLFDEREQNITIHAEDKELALAAFILESVETMTGDFSADIQLTGKPDKPHLEGKFVLSEGIIKLIDLKDPLVEVELLLTMSDNRVTVVQATALVPHSGNDEPGTIFAGGTVELEDINTFVYDLNLTAHMLPLNYELGDFTGLADAEVAVQGATPPVVSGVITMHNAVYRESFEEETGFSILTALEADKTWDLNLMVDCPSNFWTTNDDIDAEYGGSLNITRIAGVYNFLGTLEVIRGKYYLFDKTFRMTPGGEIIYDNIEELDPRLILEITTRIRTQARYTGFEAEDSYTYELPLLVTGTLNNPIITVADNAPISNENILPSILTNTTETSTGQSTFSDRITVGSVGLLANQFSRLGSRTLGVETFEINPGYSGGFDPSGTRITIGTYTLPNLYIFGSSYFDVNKGQEVGVEYRLSKHYLFEGRRDEFNLYHFSFKFHWEY
ncbi:MAG: translocation/assembly module TamB domain-containing protein [Candidatus Zixiibacteriota bacterium]